MLSTMQSVGTWWVVKCVPDVIQHQMWYEVYLSELDDE